MPKIVIVDDQEAFLNSISKIIKDFYHKEGISCEIRTYDKADLLIYDIKDKQFYDIYFLDIEMSKIDGIHLAKFIRKMEQEAIIVFITSHMEFLLMGYEVNAYQYIPKMLLGKKLPDILNKIQRKLVHTEMLEYNYINLCNNYKDSKEIFHDFNAHIAIISQLAKEDNNREQLIEYIDGLWEPIVRLINTLSSGNEMVDMILNYKLWEAEDNAIEIKYSVTKFLCSDVSVKDSDLCIILSNLLDNAIEACKLIKNGKRWIKLSIKHVNDLLIICVENSMEKQPKYENGKLLSIKADKRLHGIGIESVRGIANKYNGYMECKHDDNKFSVDLTLSC